MDFKVSVLKPREGRALLLMAVALLAIIAASIAYLRPAVPGSAATSPIASSAATAVGPNQPAEYLVLPGTGRPTGSYVIWDIGTGGGWGGH